MAQTHRCASLCFEKQGSKVQRFRVGRFRGSRVQRFRDKM